MTVSLCLHFRTTNSGLHSEGEELVVPQSIPRGSEVKGFPDFEEEVGHLQ